MSLHHGDCLDVMAEMGPESVDAIVTDPPYGLEFMGKEWDKLDRDGAASFVQTEKVAKQMVRTDTNYVGKDFPKASPYANKPRWSVVRPEGWVRMQAWHHRWAEAAFRVAKPSAYLLAFGGTRTVHRMTVAIEDAGWIIRDMLVWAYASGFPKSKASLKPAWEPIVMARKPGPLRELAIDECRIPTDDRFGDGAHAVSIFGSDGNYEPGPNAFVASENGGRWPANVILTDPIFDGGWDGVVGGGDAPSAGRYREADVAKRQGSRGGLGQDGLSHLATLDDGRKNNEYANETGTYSRFFQINRGSEMEPWQHSSFVIREPDEGCECTACEYLRSEPCRSRGGMGRIDWCATHDSEWPVDEPRCTTYSRFFLIPKAARADREPVLGGLPERVSRVGVERHTGNPTAKNGQRVDIPRANVHPTVKPVDLMRHLIRLVTPTGGTVLDPFLGSGTTAIAAEMEGFDWIGIEKEAEYVAIAEARLNGTQRGLGLPA